MELRSLKPVIGYRHGRGRGRLLLVCYYDPNGIPTIYENIANWQEFSRYNIEVFNFWPGRGGAPLRLPETLDLSSYTGIIVHCTLSYFPSNLFALDQSLKRPFEEFDGLKILMKQDEHVQTNKFAEFIAKKKFDIVITCLPPEEVEKVYPRDVVGDIDFIHAFTGYVSPALRGLRRRQIQGRPLDISYRGSIQPLEVGRLGYEKRGVGYDVAAATLTAPDLNVDISSRWEDRIGGDAWFTFLSKSKIVLGAESGSNLFDFTGEVATWCREYEARNTGIDPYSKDYYIKAHEEHLHLFEGNVKYAQISPRHFEAAVCGATQILYEGEYSGIFKPYRHFFPLKRDLSNMGEALDFARDDRRLQEFADCAYEEIIQNPANHYEHFVEIFDSTVERRIERRQAVSRLSKINRTESAKSSKALMLMAHDPSLDPRIDWFSEALTPNFDVCEIGVYQYDRQNMPPSIERLSERRMRIRVDGAKNRWNFVARNREVNGGQIGLTALTDLFLISELPPHALAKAVGALDATVEDLDRFSWYCNFFLSRNSALLEASRQVGSFDLVVAADLHSLPAAVVLAEERNVPLVYDAHEYWPYSLPEFRHWETEFWSQLEAVLLKAVTVPLTVTPQLAEAMGTQYGTAFDFIPNCASLGAEKDVDLEAVLADRAGRDELIFIVQGQFGAHRGFEKLINAWDKTDPRAKLWLRGPDSPYKSGLIDLAKSKGIFNQSVFFPEAVDETDLVRAAREADIGIIPYEATSVNNRYCSPNKLSQFMAAGLPIICNELDFVKSIVLGNGIGSAVDFSDEAALVRTINEYVTNRDPIPSLSRKSQETFKAAFNWQFTSRDIFERIHKIVSANGRSESEFDFAWINDAESWTSAVSMTPRERERFQMEEEMRKYNAEMVRINDVYQVEIARLNRVYSDENDRLRSVVMQAVKEGSLYFKLRRAARPLKAVVKAIARRAN